MKKTRAMITAVGGYVPELVVTNAELEENLRMPKNWIAKYLGVQQRRLLRDAGKGTSVICKEAALEICRKRGISPADIEVILIATSTPDMITPSTASIVAREIGAVKAWGVDISNACSGFLTALDIGSKYIEQGRHRNVLVLGADKMSGLINPHDRIGNAVFADGGGGVLLEPCTTGEGIQDCYLKTDGTGGDHLYIKAGGSAWPATLETVTNGDHYMKMDGKAIFDNAVNCLVDSIGEMLQRHNLTPEDLAWIVPHQANQRILKCTAEVLSFPLEKVMINIDRYGNTTAGTIPLCLWDYEKKLKQGDRLIFAAFGAGFTWGAMYVIWGYNT